MGGSLRFGTGVVEARPVARDEGEDLAAGTARVRRALTGTRGGGGGAARFRSAIMARGGGGGRACGWG